MKIAELDRQKYGGLEIAAGYDSAACYDMRVRSGSAVTSFELVKNPCPRFHREYRRQLFAKDHGASRAFGLWDQGRLAAVMEILQDSKTDRTEILTLFVDEPYRRRGFGRMMLDKAREFARGENRRAVIMRIDSCNSGAVAFALSQGLRVMGFDLTEAENDDRENHVYPLLLGQTL